MSLLDLLRRQYLMGRVVEKHTLDNGDLGIIVEDRAQGERYHVYFRDGYKGPCADNLYGLLKDPFSGKTAHLKKLIQENDTIELTVSYSRGPFREAYGIRSVTNTTPYRKSQRTENKPFNPVRVTQYS